MKIAVIVADERWRKDAAALRLMRRAVRLGLTSPPHPLVALAPRSLSPKGGEGRAFAAPKRLRPRRRGEGAVAVTLLLADDARLKALNRDFRGKNKPTNVLSFPAALPAYLGDVAIAYQIVASEARAQGKSFADHAAHLALHGVLHLLGYDHKKKSEASAMESLETRLLAKLGIASPYVLPSPYEGEESSLN